jgi:hypothetical protein
LPNSAASFVPASGGSKATAAAIAFPPAKAAYTVRSVFLADAATADHTWVSVELATPLVVKPGDAPTIRPGDLKLVHAPVPGRWGSATDYAWGKVHDAAFGGSPFAAPSVWYAAYESGPGAEPAPGTGYARVAVPNDADHWMPDVNGQPGDIVNVRPIAFPAASATQGQAGWLAIYDRPDGGNPWWLAPVTAPISPAAGGSAPTIGTGAMTISF